jgi:hypothetical protein
VCSFAQVPASQYLAVQAIESKFLPEKPQAVFKGRVSFALEQKKGFHG